MKQDKKKLFVIGALVMVLCAIGAFTMMGGGPAPVASTTGSKADAKKDLTEATKAYAQDPTQAKIGAIIGSISGYGTKEARDPFAIPSGVPEIAVTPPAPQAPVPGADTHAPAPRQQRPKPLGGGDSIPPWTPPTQGAGAAPGPIVPRFRVKGALVGQKPVVVVEDSSGNQRLVPVGGELEPGTRITSIEKGQVTVSEHGKSKTMPIGEGS
ncbi:MAG: hypothetical protein JSS65_09365 [Armatimonadetes bacterium]|nr:hypothetical protein [Armatimonadota bacterium]